MLFPCTLRESDQSGFRNMKVKNESERVRENNEERKRNVWILKGL